MWPKLSRPRKKASATALEDSIVVAGGISDGYITSSVEYLRISGNVWTEISPMSVGRENFGLCAIGNQLYAVGGSKIGSIEMYEDDSWKYGAPLPRGTLNCGGVAVLDHMFREHN